MIIWQDNAIIIAHYPLDNKKNRLILLTQMHGKVPLACYQQANQIIGNIGKIDYKARLSEHLGQGKFHSTHEYGAHIVFSSPLQLHICHAVCDLLNQFLPQMQAFSELYQLVQDLLALTANGVAGVMRAYCLFELQLLQYLGYGLSLDQSVLSGARDNLYYVSPKSGCAVTRAEGQEYADKLLVLPEFFTNPTAPISSTDIIHALQCTGYFYEKHLFAQHGGGFIRSRSYFAQQYAGLQAKFAGQ